MDLATAGAAAGTHWAAVVTGTAAVVTAAVAIAAAWFARRQVILAATDRRERLRPAVVVDLITRDDVNGVVYLELRNIGQTTARNVWLEFDPPIWSDGDAVDDGLRTFVQQRRPTMPPGRDLTTVFAWYPEYGDRPRRFEATVHCDDYRGRPQTPEVYILDVDVAVARSHIQRDTTHEINQSLKEIVKRIDAVTGNNLATGKGLRTYPVTLAERRKEGADALARQEERRRQAEDQLREAERRDGEDGA